MATLVPAESSSIPTLVEWSVLLGAWIPVLSYKEQVDIRASVAVTIDQNITIGNFIPEGTLQSRFKYIVDGRATELACADIEMLITWTNSDNCEVIY